jgi:FkbH-like protein
MSSGQALTELRQQIKEAAAKQDAATALSLATQMLASSNKHADAMFCASVLGGLSVALETQTAARRLKTYIVRSVTLEPLLPFLTVEAAVLGYILDTRMGGYGSYVDELLNVSSPLAQFQPDLVVVALDVEEIAGSLADRCAGGIDVGVAAEIDECAARIEQLLRSLRSSSSTRIVLQGLVVPDYASLGDVGDANLPYSLPNAVAELNRRLAALCRAMTDCVFFDLDRLAARHGRARWRDERMYLASRLPVASEFFRPYARGLVRSFSTLFRVPRKVLCTDLDNTLWGGILGEDGPDGIATGSAFPGNCYLAYQRYLKQLSARGILLAIVSKNNKSDVQDAFASRSADLALKLSDFVATKIGWDEKPAAIRELAEELSLGLDSFVFVDDNPVECEAVHRQLPEVAILQAPAEEPWKLVELLAERPFFDAITVTQDDVHRVDEYKAQAQRAELAVSTGSRDEFLASLVIVCTFQSALEAPLARAVQLLAKTNQFNLTTRRRSAAEVEEFASSPGGQAIVIRVRDRFGDAGVVGLALARTDGGTCSIDSLLLSCRVIGRGIETALLAHIAENAQQAGASRLLGEFIPTKKNAPCATFYTDHGFAACAPRAEASDSVFYELDLTTSAPVSPAWIALEGSRPHELSASPAVPA